MDAVPPGLQGRDRPGATGTTAGRPGSSCFDPATGRDVAAARPARSTGSKLLRRSQPATDGRIWVAGRDGDRLASRRSATTAAGAGGAPGSAGGTGRVRLLTRAGARSGTAGAYLLTGREDAAGRPQRVLRPVAARRRPLGAGDAGRARPGRRCPRSAYDGELLPIEGTGGTVATSGPGEHRASRTRVADGSPLPVAVWSAAVGLSSGCRRRAGPAAADARRLLRRG